MKVRILLADDHKILRQGLRALLEKEPGMEVVAEAATGREAVRLAREHKPDIVVMDVSMPDLDGIEAARAIRGERPDTKILGLSMHLDGQLAAGLIRSGASGYLLKTGGCDELCQAIREVLAGRTYLSPDVAALVVAACTGGTGDNAPGVDSLTPRQREVLQLYTAGHSTKEIAIRIGRSIKTVEMHRQHIMEKLRLHSIADLTKYAIRKGLTSLDS